MWFLTLTHKEFIRYDNSQIIVIDEAYPLQDYQLARMATSSCLANNDKCHYLGTIGNCCSGNCVQTAEEAFGYCGPRLATTSSATTTSPVSAVPAIPIIPAKCLTKGATCAENGSLGYCCSTFCLVLAPHTTGECVKREKIVTHHQTHETSGNSWVIYTSTTVPIVIIITLCIIYLLYRQRRLEKGLSKKEVELFFNGDPESTLFNGFAHESAINLPYNKDYELTEKDFSIDQHKLLGSGCYGLVIKGTVKEMDAAVKTVKNDDANGSHLRSLLSEIKVLQYIGKFENIVSMLGCHTSQLTNGKVYLFLEFCLLGSLEAFLRSNKYMFTHGSRRYENAPLLTKSVDCNPTFDLGNLLTWSLQITNGMKFLKSKKVIHADLATRNVLLLNKDCAKITDFGLSRRLYEYSNYVKKHQEPLPWRWMALESLRELTFSHQSDVWSLGITFWEIYSLGGVPYPGLSWTQEFMTNLENNLRPVKPPHSSDEIFGIMTDCWRPNPDERPSFDEIYKRLSDCKKQIE